MPELLDTCARELMDTAPQITQSIRVEMRQGRGSDLTIPQFRTLRFIQSHIDSTLSNLADHLGLTLPSVSNLLWSPDGKWLVLNFFDVDPNTSITALFRVAGCQIIPLEIKGSLSGWVP